MAPQKIILVTGANSGIGYSTTKALIAASAQHHVIMGCRDTTKGQSARDELEAMRLPGTLSLVELELAQDKTIQAVVDYIRSEHGVLDVLINNAGIAITGAKDRRGELLESININSVSPFLLAEAVIPLLKKSHDPRIINVSSELGSITERLNTENPAHAHPVESYRMAKAALNMSTACLWAMNKQWGLKTFSFCPGLVVTNLTGEADKERRREMGADSPDTSAEGLLAIVEGKRDDEVGLFLRRWGQRFDW